MLNNNLTSVGGILAAIKDGAICGITSANLYTLKAGKSSACMLAGAVLCRHLASLSMVGQRITVWVLSWIVIIIVSHGANQCGWHLASRCYIGTVTIISLCLSSASLILRYMGWEGPIYGSGIEYSQHHFHANLLRLNFADIWVEFSWSAGSQQ